MKKRGTWEDRGNQEGSSTNQQPQIKGGKAESVLIRERQDMSRIWNSQDMIMKKKTQTLEEKKKLFLERLQHPLSTQL